MSSKAFDPNGIGRPNGNFFGFPHSLEEAEIALLPVCWDVTTSYGDGTSKGPEAIIEASVQLDFEDPFIPEAWKNPYGTVSIDPLQKVENAEAREKAKKIIEALEKGLEPSDSSLAKEYKQVNAACQRMVDRVYEQSCALLDDGKLVGLVGGDHSTPLGLMKAIDERYDSWGILHIDAHADLRPAYEGFTYSHASIMHNVLAQTSVDSIVQVGLRDLCPQESQVIANDYRISALRDFDMHRACIQGRTLESVLMDMVNLLPTQVYISFDIDGLNPAYCPNTGTPVPGGFEFEDALFLIESLIKTGREIIGFDLVEVAPGESGEWDANVGARMLYRLGNLAYFSRTLSRGELFL